MAAPAHGVARTLSKLGWCSRTAAAALVAQARVRVDGAIVLDPEQRVRPGARIEVDGVPVEAAARVCIALNKPRGLTTSARDERGRDTVYACLADAGLPWLAPVGRLDRASEGLLFLTNDPAWAAAVTDPAAAIEKTYHVQLDGRPDDAVLAKMRAGVEHDGERLAVRSVRRLREGERNAWLEIVLDEGRNRQIRRIAEALGYGVLRLVRVAIGPVTLGTLAKGAWRRLEPDEIAAFRP
jgi:23S rRNA pseudouridine2605 synthase